MEEKDQIPDKYGMVVIVNYLLLSLVPQNRELVMIKTRMSYYSLNVCVVVVVDNVKRDILL